jgi:capsular exopolysaccharide synthesis family protein
MGFFKSKKTKHNAAFSALVSKKTLHKNLDFTATEQYKLLRTNLAFTLPGDLKCPIVGITSSIKGEGKSTTAVNLAYVLAEKGSRVLLIDGDLRMPSLAKKLDIASTPGLTDFLMGNGVDMEQFRTGVLENWYILPAGNIPPNPSELLGSPRMKAVLDSFKEMFDFIIVDLPPVNVVSDALSISGFISGLVLVIREEYTEKSELEHCFRQLEFSNVKLLGCVMNESRSEGGSYGKYRKNRYYRYRYRKYGYGDYYAHRRPTITTTDEVKTGNTESAN